MTRHVLRITDLSAGELAEVLERATRPSLSPVLAGKGAALLFEHPSARTRNAAEMAVVQLGGHPVTIRGEEIGIGARETVEDVARTLACFHRVLAARVVRHGTLEAMRDALDAGQVPVPVLNLLSDLEHPTQAVADLLTVAQHFGSLEGRTVAYIGDANNVCRSLTLACAMTGVAVHVAAPEGHGLDQATIENARALGGEVACTSSPEEAAKGADVLYSDVWLSMGDDADPDATREAFAGFTIDDALLDKGAPGAVLLHCLPAHRGEEVTAAVLEGPRSLVFAQAENRMHALRALLSWMLEAEAHAQGRGAQG